MIRNSFNDNWVYTKKDGTAKQVVTLPHDAMIHDKRDADSPGGSALGYFVGGVYVYEKTFTAPEDWAHKQIYMEFEGVYQNSKVWFNGREVGGTPNGYVPFWLDLSDFVIPGAENTIYLEADNSLLPNSRWYSGGGIYRPVWMYVGEKKHIKPEGVHITTLSYNPARICVETSHLDGEVEISIIDPHGSIVASGKGDHIEFDVPNAELWSSETPILYTCMASLVENGRLLDSVGETFGIRKIEWSPMGLFVNGKETLLRGGCIHHDNGILGGATFAQSEERRVRIMKKTGFNALRSSHNLTSKSMLEACDKLGMYMIDETWDMWYFHKSKYDYATHFLEWYQYDLKAMIKRDFNHPSVIMYSVGNEVSEPKEQKGVDLINAMVAYVHKLDDSRPATAGINLMVINAASQGNGIYNEEGGLADEDSKKKQPMDSSTMFNMITSQVGTSMNNSANSEEADEITSPCLDALDIAGYNYTSGRYPMEGEAHPDRIIVGSETFPQDICKNWEMVKRYPYLIGDFMWSAWDYLGEAGLGAWAYTDDARAFDKPYPWLLSETGAIDILGNVGAGAEYAAIVWGVRKKPYMAVQPANHQGIIPAKAVWRGTNAIPSWSWMNCDGNDALVEVYADADSVALFLDGTALGKEPIEACKAMFNVKYKPGKLMAIVYDHDGCEIGQTELASAVGETAIRIRPESDSLAQGGIAYIPIELVGSNGVIESNDDRILSVEVDNGELLAFGSANPRTEERYDNGKFATYYGRALAIVRATRPGALVIRVTSDIMPSVEATIAVK